MKHSVRLICALLAGSSSVSYAGGPGPLNLNPVNSYDSNNFNRNLVGANSSNGYAAPEAPTGPAKKVAEVPKLTGASGGSMVDAKDETEISDKMRYFDLVIVVNKATTAQTITVYQKKFDGKDAQGNPTFRIDSLWGRDENKKAISRRVSTGVEEYGCATPQDPITKAAIGQPRSILKQTPTGYFTVDRVDIDHRSSKYENAPMPYAVFIHDDLDKSVTDMGIATHRAPGAGDSILIGNRESHACMRLHIEDAQEVFKQVLLTGGPINRKSDNLNARMDDAYNTPDRMAQGQQLQADRNVGYRAFMATVPESPNAEMPVIPQVNRMTGDMDPAKSRQGYKTLYIIENVEVSAPRNYIVTKILNLAANARIPKGAVQQTSIYEAPGTDPNCNPKKPDTCLCDPWKPSTCQSQWVEVRGAQAQPYVCDQLPPEQIEKPGQAGQDQNSWGWDNNRSYYGNGNNQQQYQGQPNGLGDFFHRMFNNGN